MNFNEATIQLSNGKKIRPSIWREECFIYYNPYFKGGYTEEDKIINLKTLSGETDWVVVEDNFCLSDKIIEHHGEDMDWREIDVENVKEFIKQIKKEIEILNNDNGTPIFEKKTINNFKNKIDKLAGDKLL